MKNNNFLKDLFVLDMANNHFGNLSHAKKIVKSFSVVKKNIILMQQSNFNLEIYLILYISNTGLVI